MADSRNCTNLKINQYLLPDWLLKATILSKKHSRTILLLKSILRESVHFYRYQEDKIQAAISPKQMLPFQQYLFCFYAIQIQLEINFYLIRSHLNSLGHLVSFRHTVVQSIQSQDSTTKLLNCCFSYNQSQHNSQLQSCTVIDRRETEYQSLYQQRRTIVRRSKNR